MSVCLGDIIPHSEDGIEEGTSTSSVCVIAGVRMQTLAEVSRAAMTSSKTLKPCCTTRTTQSGS